MEIRYSCKIGAALLLLRSRSKMNSVESNYAYFFFFGSVWAFWDLSNFLWALVVLESVVGHCYGNAREVQSPPSSSSI